MKLFSILAILSAAAFVAPAFLHSGPGLAPVKLISACWAVASLFLFFASLAARRMR